MFDNMSGFFWLCLFDLCNWTLLFDLDSDIDVNEPAFVSNLTVQSHFITVSRNKRLPVTFLTVSLHC